MKKEIVILGGGTSGTMMSNHLIKKLNHTCNITVIDEDPNHYYQPGFLFIPFGIYKEKDVVKPKKDFLNKDVNFILKNVSKIDKDNNVLIFEDNSEIKYDILIIATGCDISPKETKDMKGENWYKNIFDFYTLEGAKKLHEKLNQFTSGKLVINITEMPIKCPVAPLEFAFLADDYFRKKGIREKIEIEYVTPLSGAFTKPKASDKLGYLLKSKNINVVTDFAIGKVDNQTNEIVDFGGKRIKYDLLVTIPTNKGSKVIENSQMGDDLNFISTDKHTLQSNIKENIFVIGDATNIPASKAGSVAHFQSEILIENIIEYLSNKTLSHKFDGHANCFIESGNGKGLLIDFNYEQEPVEGSFPFPVIGPMSLLKESKLNHFGKMAFKWIYWNMLLPAKKIPFIGVNMSKLGKKLN